jgi:DnaK suppressor protein
MDDDRARELLRSERRRTEQQLEDVLGQGQSDRSGAAEGGEMFDPAQSLGQEQVDEAVTVELRSHLEAVERAELRLAAGTFGRSVRSGLPIPDDRLEADPTAELTVEEAGAGR